MGVGSLRPGGFGRRGGTILSLRELPANPLIKHANGFNCSMVVNPAAEVNARFSPLVVRVQLCVIVCVCAH